MGSGYISSIFIINMVGVMICGFIWSMVTLIYKSIDEREFNPVSFWFIYSFSASSYIQHICRGRYCKI